MKVIPTLSNDGFKFFVVRRGFWGEKVLCHDDKIHYWFAAFPNTPKVPRVFDTPKEARNEVGKIFGSKEEEKVFYWKATHA